MCKSYRLWTGAICWHNVCNNTCIWYSSHMLSFSKMGLQEVRWSSPPFLLSTIMLPKRAFAGFPTHKWILYCRYQMNRSLCFCLYTKSPEKCRIICSSYICISLQGFAGCLELCSLEPCFPQELNKDGNVFLNSVLWVRCFIIKCFTFKISKSLLHLVWSLEQLAGDFKLLGNREMQ